MSVWRSVGVVLGLLWLSAARASASPAQDDSALGSSLDAAERAHDELLAREPFPLAHECGACHPRQFREWSVSPHAYAQISPTYNAYQALLVELTNGTLGDFCVRCHTEVGMTLGEPIIASNLERSEAAREGISCITCHRVGQAYGKNVGRFALEQGDIQRSVWGPHEPEELERVIASPDTYKRVTTERGVPGRRIHAFANELPQMRTAGFCGRCHDVRLVDGFRLEDAFSEYKQSPAAADGQTCQDCHMGPIPGRPSQYPEAPAATVGGVPTQPTRRTSHLFAAVDVPLVHPGVFPHNPDAQAFAELREWLTFRVNEGWGTDEFEDTEPDDDRFPERWASIDDRYEARAILDEQFALLRQAREAGSTLLRNGYGLGEIVDTSSPSELAFEIEVRNLARGHSAPTGLIAERMVFLQVEVRDANDVVQFRSGDLDPSGDVRDRHSEWVRQGVLPHDDQLFNLRSPFLARNLRGSEREQVIPANYSFDPLPFVRPSPTPSLLMGGVSEVRLQKRNIPPEGGRVARYRVPSRELSGAGPYEVRVKLVAGALPVHLIRTISSVGFEWGLTERDVAEGVLDGYRVLWSRTAALDLR